MEEQYWVPPETVNIYLVDGNTAKYDLITKSDDGLSGVAVDGEETIRVIFIDGKWIRSVLIEELLDWAKQHYAPKFGDENQTIPVIQIESIYFNEIWEAELSVSTWADHALVTCYMYNDDLIVDGPDY